MSSVVRRLLVRPTLAVGIAAVLSASLASLLSAQATGSVRGRVIVEGANRPLPQAQVGVVGTALGAQTNDNGEYRLNNVPAGPRTLRVVRLGFAPTSEQVTVVAGETATLDFTIREAPVALEQVVVTATGDVRRKEITNSMATISAEQIQNAPVANAQQLLSAQTPGVTVLANSGQPGAGGQIRLRGNNSISQDNNPIIYVDGVRIYSGNSPTVPNARQTINPFNDIRAEDIERVEVVKGAAATTLYGTEASGGVIQIFTKRGRAGRPQWNLDLTGGTNDLNSISIDGDPTAVYLKDCRGPELFGIEVTPSRANFGENVPFEDATCPSSGKWVRTGAVQKAALSVAGGSDVAQYFLAGNLSNEEGALKSNEYTTGGFRGNFSFRPMPKLEVALNSSYQRGDQDWIADGNLANGFLLNVARGTAGNYNGSGCATAGIICKNNDAALQIGTKTKSDHYISGFTVNYSPLDAWTNRLSVGFDYNNAENRSIIPFGHLRNQVGQIVQGNWVRQFLSVDYASTYKKDFGSRFTTSTSVGGQLFQDNLSSVSVTGDEFSGPGDPVLTSAARRTVGTDTRRRVVNAGLFFQEQVGWNDRAFLTLGMRVDGNSAFGKDFGLQYYPKVGFAYALSDHDFWPKDLIETFKLRTAVGESGKAPGAFDAVRTWDPIAGDEAKPGFTPNQLGNPTLGPERTRETEVGLEASALAGRFSVDMTYFNTTTSDALIQVRYPPSQGFLNRQLENVGEVNNTGLEVKFDAGLIRRTNFDWRGRLNFTKLKSEATDLGDEPLIAVGGSFTEVRVGYPVTSLFARKILNADKLEAPVRSDTNVYIGPTWPTNIIGLGTSLTLWDKVTIDGLGEFQKGGYNINYVGYQNAIRGNWRPCYDDQRKIIAAAKGNASAVDGISAINRVRCGYNSTQNMSDAWIEKIDFFRLRYVTMTYRIPSRWIPGSRGGALTLAGRNLFLSTDYSGLDPESSDQQDSQVGRREYYTLPQLRSFSLSFRTNW
ncbi:MAG: SusC/RagA family TonB-linked outer membrane protein [Propionibacteriaceae bacterium]|nr:SusC/RagA family TonB-linked outer membrane protein [Propionibacteriaceae bacterium]